MDGGTTVDDVRCSAAAAAADAARGAAVIGIGDVQLGARYTRVRDDEVRLAT